MKIYDFTQCDGIKALAAVIDIINRSGYTLVSVTQFGHTYTVFFQRAADG